MKGTRRSHAKELSIKDKFVSLLKEGEVVFTQEVSVGVKEAVVCGLVGFCQNFIENGSCGCVLTTPFWCIQVTWEGCLSSSRYSHPLND